MAKKDKPKGVRGRPAATTVNSYIHTPGNHNDLRIKMMALKLELGGHPFASSYGLFYMLTDAIADAPYYGIEMNSTQLGMLAYDFHVPISFLSELIEAGSDPTLNLFTQEFSPVKSLFEYRLTSPWLNEKIVPILERRLYQRNYYSKTKGLPPKEIEPPVVKPPVDMQKLLPEPPVEKKPGPEIIIHPLQKYIKDHYPTVSKMKKQLTAEDCAYLIKRFSNVVVKEYLERMDNWVPQLKTNSNVRRTMLNWIEMDNKRQKGKGTGAPDATTYEPE